MRGTHGTDKLDLAYISTGERVVTVVARMEEFIGYGTAIRDDHDQWNPEVGFGLATGRALCDIGAQMKRAAWAQVPQRADLAELERILADLKRRDNRFVGEVDTADTVWEDDRPWYERVLGHLFR